MCYAGLYTRPPQLLQKLLTPSGRFLPRRGLGKPSPRLYLPGGLAPGYAWLYTSKHSTTDSSSRALKALSSTTLPRGHDGGGGSGGGCLAADASWAYGFHFLHCRFPTGGIGKEMKTRGLLAPDAAASLRMPPPAQSSQDNDNVNTLQRQRRRQRQRQQQRQHRQQQQQRQR